MAPLTRAGLLALALAPALASCDDLVGFGGAPTPLARVRVEVTGELEPLRPPGTEGETPRLRVALVWAAQWLPEAFCFLPAESPEAAAVIQAGCRDSLGFAPERVAAGAEVAPGAPATIELFELPSAEVMIGDVTARIAYASLLVYDDRDGDGTLGLYHPQATEPDEPDGGALLAVGQDLIYGASFLSMTLPDQRLAFREGAFNALAAFYPRSGCGTPPPAFSILSAGGFSAEDAYAAALEGRLPEEDPAGCAERRLDEAVVAIALRPPADISEVGCRAQRPDGRPFYADPGEFHPRLRGATWACVGLPKLGANAADPQIQLVIATPPSHACKELQHYILRGCDEDASCDPPFYDHTAQPPDWWPCPVVTSAPPAAR